MTTPAPTPTNKTGCPRSCPTADHCKASIAIPCPQGRFDEGPTGRFQPCGCLERERCTRGCGMCTNCDGCYCGED
ncbi:hypothetical protein GCM10027258_62980 [Amycolatopsis stemonae]